MAARQYQEDEEETLEIKRLHRRPSKKKPPKDDDDEKDARGKAGGKGGKKGKKEEEEPEEEELLESSGNIWLDILLDYRDDCFYWGKTHLIPAIIICVVSFVLFFTVTGLTIRYIVNYLTHPTIQDALQRYEVGAYVEAKEAAEIAISYLKKNDYAGRAEGLYVIGASTCSIADIARDLDRKPFYLMAANYLKEAAEYGYIRGHFAKGNFLLGKSLYFSDELVACREPLLDALDSGQRDDTFEPKLPDADRQKAHFFLAHSYFLDIEPDYEKALAQIKTFRAISTISEEDTYEADVLQTLILIQMGDVDVAESHSKIIPLFQRFVAIRHFIAGQIALIRARRIRQEAVAIEKNRQADLSDIRLDEEEQPPAPPSRIDRSPQQEPTLEVPELERLLPTPLTHHQTMPESRLLQRLLPVAFLEEEDDTPPPPELTPPQAFDPNRVILLPTETSNPDDKARKDGADEAAMDERSLREKKAAELHDHAQNQYEQALVHFQKAIQTDTLSLRWRRQTFQLIGTCYDEMGDMDQAQRVYLNLIETNPMSSEAIAVQFLWSEIEMRRGHSDAFLMGVIRTFDQLRQTPNYGNPWLTRRVMVDRTEEAFRQSVIVKDYNRGLLFLYTLRDIAPKETLLRYWAETNLLWANDLYRQATAQFGDVGLELTKEAEQKFRIAGRSYSELADVEEATENFELNLWNSAEAFRRGKDYRRTIDAYKRYLRFERTLRQTESFLAMAEAAVHLDLLDDAEKYYMECLTEYPNHKEIPRVRLGISQVYFEKGQPEKAEEVLRQNLIGAYPPESVFYRDSIYALGKLLYETGKLVDAIPPFEEALQLHPDAIQAPESHYMLAQAYTQRSKQTLEQLNEVELDDAIKAMETKALLDSNSVLEHLQRSEEMLVKRENAVGLTEAERLMLYNARFAIGKTLMNLKRYRQAISMFDVIVTRYQDEPKSIDGLIQIASAYRILNQSNDAIAVLNRADVQLQTMVRRGIIPAENSYANQIAGFRKLLETPP